MGTTVHVDKVVSETLALLVSHYGQNNHAVEEYLPYFDLKQSEIDDVSSVDESCLRHLASLPDFAISKWLVGYATTLQPLLQQFRLSAVSVLKHYELILGKWLERILGNIDPCKVMAHGKEKEPIPHVLAALSTDLTFFACCTSIPELTSFVRCNIVIPYLLRVQ